MDLSSITKEDHAKKEISQEDNPLYSFMYALKSSEARRQYPKRLKMLFGYLKISDSLENQSSEFPNIAPYNHNTAHKMYGTDLPATSKLLKAAARVCKAGSLLFLLLGPQNYQWCPSAVKRIGWVAITVVPNNELRVLNIFYKYVNGV